MEYIREKYISPEECERVLHRGALFYEDNGEIAHAMEIYYRSGDLEKLSLLLMQSANDPSEVAYDYRTIPYYRALLKGKSPLITGINGIEKHDLLSIGRFGGKANIGTARWKNTFLIKTRGVKRIKLAKVGSAFCVLHCLIAALNILRLS